MVLTQTFSDTNLDADLIAQAAAAFEEIMNEKDQGRLPVLSLPGETSHISELEPVAEYFRTKFKTVIVLGTGGSSLGGQSLVALAQDPWGLTKSGPKVIFLDNIDPETFERLFDAIELDTTGFIAISKSGNTAETLCQLYSIIDFWKAQSIQSDISNHFLVITEPKNSELTAVAETHNFSILPHDPNIGGRFAALSLVGLLPAMIAGLDAQKILMGAQSVLSQSNCSAIEGSAWTMQHHSQGKTLSVMMPYCDRLNLLGKWYRQLWAESLGKEEKGITPIAASGTVDQHSQLQLYLDGPKDKMFTFLCTQHSGQGLRIQSPGSLQGDTMGDLMQAEQRATVETVTRRGIPVRVMDLQQVDEEALGALMMHFMLETMIVARMMHINAFDQPAVEEGKILAKQYLKEVQAA